MGFPICSVTPDRPGLCRPTQLDSDGGALVQKKQGNKMKTQIRICYILFLSALLFVQISAVADVPPGREKCRMDFGWKFALGHAFEAQKDYNHGTGYFSYFAKTGYGDGPAAADFDDRAWRILNLPHDWAVERPFDSRGGHSHGYRAIGREFPENSIGWYRKTFSIPESDLGRRIVIQFDGIHRNATLWVNGFYIAEEHSGYSSFQYDITDYLNYGGDNVIAVRADVIMEEGWFYEGAGIYRHVWLTKTSPLHVGPYGTFVTSEIKDDAAVITAKTTIVNETGNKALFNIRQTVRDGSGKAVVSAEIRNCLLGAAETGTYRCTLNANNPNLWSLESPSLYRLSTSVCVSDTVIDQVETPFGIRTIRFDPDHGFFLNGQHVPLKGTNNHQDHAGVGTAIPDALQEFRIRRLKEMGCNAYRCAHNPPTPELLDACDRLGMLVLDENRLMGSSPEQMQQLERMILRDRNHPCVIAWSLGNEEWAIEGNIKGARIASAMQDFARRLDPTRRITVASSGGWGNGVSAVIDVMGFNYLSHGDIDAYHTEFPDTPGMGTEETTGSGTRGIYADNRKHGHMAQMDRVSGGPGIERGIAYYASRPYLAGLFFWTGFDYRGEPNPLAWPSVSSQFGILDLCGFSKDLFYCLQAVWTDEPVLHLLPHWNREGKESGNVRVWAYTNCEEVELFLNGQSFGTRQLEPHSHLEWEVPYAPGALLARGTRNGDGVTRTVETTGPPAGIRLIPDRNRIRADGQDVSVIAVQVEDAQARIVPEADNEIRFSIRGPGKIIGVGNGDPASHEPDRFFETIRIAKIKNLKELAVKSLQNRPEIAAEVDDTNWKKAFTTQSSNWREYTDSLIVVRGTFVLPDRLPEAEVTLLTKSIVENQSVFINGQRIAGNVQRDDPDQSYRLDHALIHPGSNVYAVTGKRFRKRHQWDEPNTDPGLVQVIFPAEPWKRRVFNGLAQIIIQSERRAGSITLTAASPGLEPAGIQIQTRQVPLQPAVLER